MEIILKYIFRLLKITGICLLCYPGICLMVYLDNPNILNSSNLLFDSFWVECLAIDLFSSIFIFVISLFIKKIKEDD